MSDFTDRVVLITGGTRGIGRACAERFAKEGARVAVCGRSLETAAQAAAAIGGQTRGFQADVACAEDVERLFAEVNEAFGPVQILVNNAGITRDGLLMRMKDDDWTSVLDTNLRGAFNCCRAAVRSMLKQRQGRIINISSVIGLRGQAGQTNYAAAKAGVIGFSKSLAQELASRGITVNVIAPGYIETDMTAVFTEDMRKAVLAQIPMGRSGTCEEIAAAVRFFASDEASYTTGAVLTVDGGLAM